jgi:hypothetical protein
MQSIEIPLSINSEGCIFIPNEYLNILPKEKLLKVIIEIPEVDSQELSDWKKITAKEFFAGYDEGDNIYDSI